MTCSEDVSGRSVKILRLSDDVTSGVKIKSTIQLVIFVLLHIYACQKSFGHISDKVNFLHGMLYLNPDCHMLCHLVSGLSMMDTQSEPRICTSCHSFLFAQWKMHKTTPSDSFFAHNKLSRTISYHNNITTVRSITQKHWCFSQKS